MNGIAQPTLAALVIARMIIFVSPTTCRFIYRAPRLVLLLNTYICCSRESYIWVIHVRSIVTQRRHQSLPQSQSLVNSYCESDVTRSSKGRVRASPFVPSYTILNRTPVLHSFSRKPPPPLRNSQRDSLSLDSTCHDWRWQMSLPSSLRPALRFPLQASICDHITKHKSCYEPFVQDFRQVKGRFSLSNMKNENPPVVLLPPHDLRRQGKHPRSFRFDAAGRPPQWEPSDILSGGRGFVKVAYF